MELILTAKKKIKKVRFFKSLRDFCDLVIYVKSLHEKAFKFFRKKKLKLLDNFLLVHKFTQFSYWSITALGCHHLGAKCRTLKKNKLKNGVIKCDILILINRKYF